MWYNVFSHLVPVHLTLHVMETTPSEVLELQKRLESEQERGESPLRSWPVKSLGHWVLHINQDISRLKWMVKRLNFNKVRMKLLRLVMCPTTMVILTKL